ncbi:MAG: dihydrofolate reductase [Bacteroidota bacterium]|nr:dihydrofolate reductase [Bacteroidota bacterium]MDP4232670.1 dihydrofolate reductase [Bacteroidota bacterium]MDP4243197.1 dihydrofolate reductase [Bacteroidota bacterium]MDP4288409.1 dihydrofolate reductase [Bacteroidota bacterium]
MKTIVVFVTTLDGKVTKWGDPHVQQWSSKEDQSYFKKTWDESPLIIMGSGTFDFAPVKPSPKNLLVIMTRNPTQYKKYVVPGQLEFSDLAPEELTQRFKDKGYGRMLVVGGPHVATSFFRDNLVDELWLTLEPKIFGTGGNFVIEEELDINLEQISIEKVNDRGTIITKYAVTRKA